MSLRKILAFTGVSLLLFASCQSSTIQKQGLDNVHSRIEIMNTIANDSIMSKEMIGILMNRTNGLMMMQNQQKMILENHGSMMNLLKENPAIIQNMLSDMIEMANGDTTILSDIFITMMGNPQMRDMMRNMNGYNRMNKRNMGSMGTLN